MAARAGRVGDVGVPGRRVRGDSYRYEWQRIGGPENFGFTGEVLELAPDRRAVTTEQMIGMAGPATTNELTLTP